MPNEKNTGLSGAVTLLTAFIAVVLIVFSMLALSQAQADARRANIAAKSSVNWYSADYKAQTTLAALRRGEIVPDTDKIGPGDYSPGTDPKQRVLRNFPLAAKAKRRMGPGTQPLRRHREALKSKTKEHFK